MREASKQLGKVPRKFLEQVIFQNLGTENPSVLVKPGHGFDNAVVSLGGEKVLILTTDPLSIIPPLGMKDSAWLTINLLASDFTTSAVKPQFAVLDFNLPPSLEMNDFSVYIKAIGEECKRLGISIVGGHTGKYPGCDYTVVGGGVLLGISGIDEYLTPAMASAGDVIIITKGAAIATTGVLASTFPHKVRERLGDALLKKARSYLYDCSTVKEALIASSLGIRDEAVTSMHDATEGGVLGGLFELSSSCGKAVVVNKDRVYVSRETRSICSIFKLDPLVSLSEGTLIITSKRDRVEEVQRRLRKNGIESFVVGQIEDSRKRGLWVSSGESKPRPFVPPARDPYWSAYTRFVRSGWN